MTNYENMINYFSDIRRTAEKSRNPPTSVFGGSEGAEHESVARLNDRKDEIKKSAKPNYMLKQDVKYDSDSSVPSSFRSDR